MFNKNDNIVPDNTPVVLLGGNLYVRADFASELYNNLQSNSFLFFKQAKIKHEFFKNYVLNETELTMKIIEQKYKINNFKVLSIKGEVVSSTYEEAVATRIYLLENKINKIVLVTDGFHSHRAYSIFRDILPPQIEIYVKSISLSGQRYNDWWNTEKGIKFYFLETIKWLNYYINRGKYEATYSKL